MGAWHAIGDDIFSAYSEANSLCFEVNVSGLKVNIIPWKYTLLNFSTKIMRFFKYILLF